MSTSNSNSTMQKMQEFLRRYSGETLLLKHALDEVGTWLVYGEDPNADFGGSHGEPLIGAVEGKLYDVIVWAVNQDGFYTWGAGGSIRALTVKKITAEIVADEIKNKRAVARIAQLEDELAKLKATLND